MKAKNILYLLLIAVVVILYTGCSSSDNDKSDKNSGTTGDGGGTDGGTGTPTDGYYYMTLSRSEVTIGADGGHATIVVTTNYIDYEAELLCEVVTADAWIHETSHVESLDEETGVVVCDITLTIDPNTGDEHRTGSVEFICGPLSDYLSVSQYTFEESTTIVDIDTCELSTYTMTISNVAQEIEFVTYTNRDFMVYTHDSWITIVSDGRAVEEYTITASVPENTENERTGTIDVTCYGIMDGDVTLTFTLIQEAADGYQSYIGGVNDMTHKRWNTAGE